MNQIFDNVIIMLNKLKPLILGLLVISLPMASMAKSVASNSIQSLQSIRDTAHAYFSELASLDTKDAKTVISVGQLDRRLRLAKCSEPLMAFESPNTKHKGRTTIGVRCDGDKPWKIYVSVNIKVIKPVVSLKKGVNRNTVLTAADLTLTEKNVSNIHRGYYTDIEQVVGKHIKNAMKSGTVLTPAHVKNPLAVKKGALVVIMADTGGIQVRMTGKAMKSGSKGDWIKVKNASSNQIVDGRIIEPGVIRVSL
jgi:flagellar basal body P-ring formation protein FlgA